MNHDTVELDLPPRAAQDTDAPLGLDDDLKQLLIQERKRFDEERQQLRREITELKRANFERDQQMAIALEREKARLAQDNVQLTGELFSLRRQLQDQTRLRAELERTQALLAEARQTIEAMQQEMQTARQKPEPPAPPAESKPAAPAFLYDDAEADARRHSFHTSGNPIPVCIAAGNDDSDTIPGWVLERSLGGFTLLLDQELPVGDRLRVRNARPNCLLPTWIAVIIKKCQPEGNSFKLVCRFVERPTWEEIQQFWG